MKKGFATHLGFTLIELLVVVLIIGILAAIALPQYRKAVEKSKIASGMTIARSVGNAAMSYQMANGAYPTDITELDVKFETTPVSQYWNVGCAYGIGAWAVGEDWVVSLGQSYILVMRNSGPYKEKGGVAMFIQDYSGKTTEGKVACFGTNDFCKLIPHQDSSLASHCGWNFYLVK